LRLDTVTELALESEVVEVRNRAAKRKTLRRHGATPDEIQFLAPWDEDDDCRRVELNAMISRQLVDFVEAALTAHGVAKVIPDTGILHQHARHLLEAELTRELIRAHADEIARRSAATELPADLATRLSEVLRKEPALSWDQALARLI